MSMKITTRKKMNQLANEILKDSDYQSYVGSSEFFIFAKHIAKQAGIELNEGTIKLHINWLEQKVKSEMPLFVTSKAGKTYDVDEDINFYFANGMQVPDSEIVDRAFEIIKSWHSRLSTPIEWDLDETFGLTNVELIKPKDYKLFAEVEDGLMVTVGKYRGSLIEEINQVAGFPTAAAGWADWMLKQNNDLTDDDVKVLQKIVRNEY